MNKLKLDKQVALINALVEGYSIRSTERMTGVHRDAIMRLLVQVGSTCEQILDTMMHGLQCQRIEVDELWCYVGKKQRHIQADDDHERVGDFYTFVAIDSNTKLVPTYRIGKRDGYNAHAFIVDLAIRLENRVQISSDALHAYVDAVDAGFGSDVDYAQIVKSYEAEPVGPGRYSPPKVVSTDKKIIQGRPEWDKSSTAYIERQNLAVRMSMRRFTRLTNGFSKKVENLKAAVALHFAYYNLVRGHRTLSGATPAMAAGTPSMTSGPSVTSLTFQTRTLPAVARQLPTAVARPVARAWPRPSAARPRSAPGVSWPTPGSALARPWLRTPARD